MDKEEKVIQNSCHFEGRAEMKYDVLEEIKQLEKETSFNPMLDDMAKKAYIYNLEVLRNRMQKL